MRAASGQVFTPARPSPLYIGCCKCCRCRGKKSHRCNKILTGRKGKDGRMRREGGAQGREGVRRGKGDGGRGGRDGLVGLVQMHLPGQRPSRAFDGGGVLATHARAPCRAARGAPQQRSYPGACALAFVCGRAVTRPSYSARPAGLAPRAARVNHGLGPGVADA